MSKTVSNDALWQKLLEMDEKLNSSKQAENAPDFSSVKDEIFDEIERQTTKLGKHYDLNHKANEQNWKTTDEDIAKILNVVSRIRKQQRETSERQVESDTGYFNFKFFKLRKTSVVITVLGLLVFTLTLFSMKQQNDYVLLNDEYYKQGVVVREMQAEGDVKLNQRKSLVK